MLTQQKTSVSDDVAKIIDTLHNELRVLGEKLQSNRALRAALDEALTGLINKRTELQIKTSDLERAVQDRKIELQAVEINIEMNAKVQAGKPPANPSLLGKFFGQGTGVTSGNSADVLQQKLTQLQKNVQKLLDEHQEVLDALAQSNKAVDAKCEEIRKNSVAMIEATQIFYQLIKTSCSEINALNDHRTQVLIPKKENISRFEQDDLKTYLDGLLNILRKDLQALDTLGADKKLLDVAKALPVFQSPSVVKTPARLPETKVLKIKPKELFPASDTTTENETLRAKVSELEKNNEELQTAKEELLKKLSTAEDNLEHAREAQILFQKEFQNFKEENQQMLQSQAELNQQQAQALQQLTEALLTKTQEYNKVAESNQALQTESQETTKQMQAMQESMKALSEQVGGYSKEVNALKKRLEQEKESSARKQKLIETISQRVVTQDDGLKEQEKIVGTLTAILEIDKKPESTTETDESLEKRLQQLNNDTVPPVTPQYNKVIATASNPQKVAEALMTDGKATTVVAGKPKAKAKN